MKSIRLHASTGDSLLFLGQSYKELSTHVGARRTIVVTDSNLLHLYDDIFSEREVIVLQPGEDAKTLHTVEFLYRELLRREADRSSLLIGVGGGVVSDVTGFVASTYMRGVDFGFVPTTLLSQIDASIGGKNGINIDPYKNAVGVFRQPRFVICDPSFLKTLPAIEVLNGMAEIAKYALIGDARLFEYLETTYDEALSLNPRVLERLIFRCVKLKSDIVRKDEFDRAERRLLNFGHTFGHALERSSSIPHGHAVSVGIVLASKVSEKVHLLSPSAVRRIESLLQKMGLPIATPLDTSALSDAIRRDKKRAADHLSLVLLKSIGHAVIKDLSLADLEEILNDLCQPRRA